MSRSIDKIKKPVVQNIIWIIVDSVRNYHTDIDDRGRIAIMDEIAKQSIEFKTAVTSAPSTVMSTSAMMTGVPAIFHSLTYNDFDFPSCGFKSLPLELENIGYNTYSIIFFPEGRDYLGPMMGNLCKEHWPAHADPRKFWDNDLVNEILGYLLNKGVEEPFFLFLNYNCRHDPETSKKVKKGIEEIKKLDLHRNAVLIINSDHGYPDASRMITFWERRKFGHDLIMTDGNILTPLIISYEGCGRKSFNTPVSLIDITPTILELINRPELIDITESPFFGKSLVPLMSGTQSELDYAPLVRIDNRYIFQKLRLSALRNQQYKYVFSFDDGVEELYDLKNDPKELNNLSANSKDKDTVQYFRGHMGRQEKIINLFHKKKLEKGFKRIRHPADRSIVLLGNPHHDFIKMLENILAGYDIDNLSIIEDDPVRKEKIKKVLQHAKIKVKIRDDVNSMPEYIDLALVIFVDDNPKRHYQLKKAAKRLRPHRTVFVNYNLKVQHRPTFWLLPVVRKFQTQLMPYMKTEPKTFFVDLAILTKRLFTS
jgi:hypothetical protein